MAPLQNVEFEKMLQFGVSRPKGDNKLIQIKFGMKTYTLFLLWHAIFVPD